MGWLLVIVALITSVPAVYYYSRVIIMMIVPEPSEKVQALSAPGQPKPWVGSPQEAPALALLVSVITVVLAGTVSVQPLMTVAQSAVSSIATRDAIPVSAQPNKPTVEIADAK